jgi:predicted nucleic acid-binding protein
MERLMPNLIDSSLWIHFTRARSPRALKLFIAPHVLDPEAAVAEPIMFEILRHATPTEARALTDYFQAMPILKTPPDLWTIATHLGQSCKKSGVNAGSIDLLIAAVAMHHDATLITFDHDFADIAGASRLRVTLLQR